MTTQVAHLIPTRKRARSAITLALAMLVGLGTYWKWWHTPGEQGVHETDYQPLLVDSTDLDLGEIWENDRLQKKVSLKNTGAEEVTVEGFDSSCNCLSVKPDRLVIGPGETATVQITVNAMLGSPPSDAQEREAVVPVRLIPRIRSTSLAKSAGWILEARVRRLLSFNPSQLSFGTIPEGRSVAAKSFRATAHMPIETLKAACPSDFGTVKVTRSQSEPGVFEITVAPQDALPPGPFEFVISIEAEYRNLGRPPAHKISARGVVEAEFQILPHILHLGARQIGETVTETVVLHSVHGETFEACAESDSKDTAVQPGSQLDRPANTFTVSQHITMSGEQTRTVTFTLKIGEGKVKSTRLKVVYIGQPNAHLKW